MIFASGDLDEYTIQSLKLQGARIDCYGVGTKLITSHSNPSLGGVYKICEVEENGVMTPKMKISDNPAKVNQSRRKEDFQACFQKQQQSHCRRYLPGGRKNRRKQALHPDSPGISLENQRGQKFPCKGAVQTDLQGRKACIRPARFEDHPTSQKRKLRRVLGRIQASGKAAHLQGGFVGKAVQSQTKAYRRACG